jgi:hypothetical protein
MGNWVFKNIWISRCQSISPQQAEKKLNVLAWNSSYFKRNLDSQVLRNTHIKDKTRVFNFITNVGRTKNYSDAHTDYICNQISYAFMGPINIKPNKRNLGCHHGFKHNHGFGKTLLT